jgi:hypothetical protein
MMPALTAMMEKLKAELGGSGRPRALIALAGLLVWIMIVSTLSQRIDAEAVTQTAARTEISRLASLVGDTSWTERSATSRALRAVLEDRFWPAPTPGLAEASFEAWLRERLQQHNLEVQQIFIARTPLNTGQAAADAAPGGTIERMTAKVIAGFRPAGAINFAADCAEKDRIVAIDRMIIRTGQNARMEIDASAFIRRTAN